MPSITRKTVEKKKTARNGARTRQPRLKWSTIYLSAGKSRFDELNVEVQQLVGNTNTAIDEALPLIKDIKFILCEQIDVYRAEAVDAGFPDWAEWGRPIAERFGCSLQALERRIAICPDKKERRSV